MILNGRQRPTQKPIESVRGDSAKGEDAGAKQDSQKKILVVYYSYTGTCRRVADLLRASNRCDVAEIKERQPRAGALGYWRCVLDSWLQRQPPTFYKGPAPQGYDAIVLLAPIWMVQLAAPMRSFIKAFNGSWPDIAVISVMGSRGAPNAVQEITTLTGRTPLMSLALTTAEVENGSMVGRVQAFIEAIESAEAESGLVARQLNLSSAT